MSDFEDGTQSSEGEGVESEDFRDSDKSESSRLSCLSDFEDGTQSSEGEGVEEGEGRRRFQRAIEASEARARGEARRQARGEARKIETREEIASRLDDGLVIMGGIQSWRGKRGPPSR